MAGKCAGSHLWVVSIEAVLLECTYTVFNVLLFYSEEMLESLKRIQNVDGLPRFVHAQYARCMYSTYVHLWYCCKPSICMNVLTEHNYWLWPVSPTKHAYTYV